ncbi:MAG: glycosyltransferase [Salibacteraceae bacterium]
MKILLIAIGTRGDVEPFLAIGEMLSLKGHEVTCQFPEQFRALAINSGLNFSGLTPQFLEMINSSDGKVAMGGGSSFLVKIGALYRIYKKSLGINHTMLMQQHNLVKDICPDRILYSTKATYAVIWEVLNPGKTINISPIPYLIHPVYTHGHIGFNGNYGKFINKLTYSITNHFLIQNITKSTKSIREELGVKSSEVKKVLLKKKMAFTISPTFYKEQSYWPENVKVFGYHEREKTKNWEPSKSLLAFIAKHEKIMFVTFGSMTIPRPMHITKMILRILRRNEIPAIINTAGGGLVEPPSRNTELFHFVDHIPYEWVLPKMHAIMHHGGSGTAHLALKYGCSSLIIPHIMDQHIWNDFNAQLGVGPKGLEVNKLNLPNLTLLILDVFFNSKFKANSKRISLKMQKEDSSKKLLDFVLN